MPTYSLGTATGTVEIIFKGDGLTQAQKGMQDLNASGMRSDNAMQKVGDTTTNAGLAIAKGLLAAVSSAATFDAKLSGIKAVSGSTAAEMELVRAKALQIGKDTAFSATDAASAMEELSKAGISTKDILTGAADATVALAAAGQIDLPQAATISANAMNQFSLKASDMPKVVDLIAGAANASAIDVSDFGLSLAQVGAVASGLGFSFGDTAVAIAELGNAGIKSSDAGTSLKTMLSRLQPTTKAASVEMQQLGLITKDGSNKFFDAHGNIKSLADIQQILKDSLKGLTAQQRQAALETIFGSDAIRAATILSKGGADGFNKMASAMGKISAADVAATRLDNMKGSIEQLRGSAETLAIGLGEIFIPAIRGIIDGLTGMLNAFLGLSPGMQKFIAISAAFVAGLLLIIGTLVKVVLFVQQLQLVWAALSTTFLASPITWVILAIIALVAALVLAYKNSETFRNIVNEVWAAVKNAIGVVVDWFVNTAWPALKSAWEAVSNAATTLWQNLVNIWNTIYSTVSTIINAIVGFIVGAWNGIVTAVTVAFNAVVTVITTYINMWKAVIEAGLNAIFAVWSAWWNLFGPLVQAVWNLIVAIIQLAWAAIRFAIEAAIAGIQVVVTAGWNAVRTATETVWNAIKAVVQAVWAVIGPYVTSAVNGVVSTVTAAWNTISSVTSSVWNAIRSVVSTVVQSIVSVVTSAFNSVKSVVSSVISSIESIISTGWNAVKSTTSSIWSSVVTIVGDKVRELLDKVRNIGNDIKNIFSGAASWLYNAGRDIIQGLINGITSLINSVTDKIKSLTSLIPSVKGPPSKDKILLRENGVLIMQGLIGGIDSMVAPLMDDLAGIGRNIPASIIAPKVGANQQPIISIPSQRGDVYYNTTVNNPLPEPAGTSVNKRLQTLTLMGA